MPQFISNFVICPETNKTSSTTDETSASDEISPSDEESDLNTHLQKQLEEDVARVFDESIYYDLEVVCGKFKILTHTCILKTRTSKFFHELENILHLNIGRKTFDEIYSFVSDVYTECNIEHQEHEIITYLNETFNTLSPLVKKISPTKKDISEAHSFCISEATLNSGTRNNFTKTKSSSPSTELTKEYYALVPITENFLEKELIEQDKLSDAFSSIIKIQVDDKVETKVSQPNKPTSLPLYVDTSNKTIIHTNNISTCLQRISKSKFEYSSEKVLASSSQVSKLKNSNELCNTSDLTIETSESSAEKVLDSTYSPDSLVTDEPSSSSDYLSATYTCSPGTSVSNYQYNLNPKDNLTKMERNHFTVSDSGIANTSILESINSDLDVTLTEMSLSESNLHSCNPEEAGNSLQYAQTLMIEKKECDTLKVLPSASVATIPGGKESSGLYINKSEDLKSGKSTKEEKQRQNEEIVTLESSSLSSETGSWESLFPPKLVERDRHIIKNIMKNNDKQMIEDKKQDLKCVDNFVVEKTKEVKLNRTLTEKMNERKVRAIPIPSQPVPCTKIYDRSQTDHSDGNDNEDSFDLLDQMEDFDLNESPLTIFDMTLEKSKSTEDIVETSGAYSTTTDGFYNTNTPNNSILSVSNSEDNSKIKKQEIKDFTSITSDVEEQTESNKGHFTRTTFKPDIFNRSIMSETDDSELTQFKPAREFTWIVDMSHEPDINSGIELGLNTSTENICENMKVDAKNNKIDNNKSQVVVESNVSEKSSHTFFIDLSSLPESIPSNKNNKTSRVSEKDNMFSMYIDIGDNSKLKGKPPILQSNSRKCCSNEPRIRNKNISVKTETLVSKTSPGERDCKKISLKIFEKIESLCNDPNIHIDDIIGNPKLLGDPVAQITDVKSNDKVNKNSESVESTVVNDNAQNSTGTRVEESGITDPTVEPANNNNSFVKLSDLDKPVVKPLSDFGKNKSKPDITLTPYEDNVRDARMTRSIPASSWGDTNVSGKSIISSFHSENASSLNRLFPHLINKFSKSVPASLSNRTGSNFSLESSSITMEQDKQIADGFEINSMQSSVGRSAVENSSTDETTHSFGVAGNCQSRLGHDLLRMFLEEIATDVIVEVNGKRIKAHKCILSSRCQFFAGILSGGYVESAGNIIVLPSFSYNVVHFVMCHIYAGLSVIPETISIMELAALTDMLGLEGLKEAIMFTLKAKYCHHFHKPCQLCLVGVLECLPLSSAYGLDDLYLKCLKWITKYFVRVWPTKAFATLPLTLLEKCYHQQTVNFTTENLIDTIFGYGIIMASLQNNRWGELLLRMCRRLIQAAAHFAAPRFVEVLRTAVNIPCNVPPPAKQALEECFTFAIEWALPEEACRTYAFLSNIVKEMKMRDEKFSKPDAPNNRKASGWNNLLLYYATSWRLQCEGVLVRSAPRVVGTNAFQDLPPELRKRLRELGCITFVSQGIPQASISQYEKKYTHDNRYNKRNISTTRSLNIDQVRAAFVPYAVKPAVPIAVMDLQNNCAGFKEPIKISRTSRQAPKVRMTKAQEQRAKFNMNKNIGNTKPLKACAQPVVKPTHLETKTRNGNDKVNKAGARKMSSSESSRNSSPSQVRRYRMISNLEEQGACEAKGHTLSQDSLNTKSRLQTAESTADLLRESHTHNIYATYTKLKHKPKDSVQRNEPTKCHTVASDVDTQCGTRTSIYITLENSNKNRQHQQTKSPAAVTKRVVKSSGLYTYQPDVKPSTSGYRSGSLMNTTKSSSAKMVSKKVTGNNVKQTKANKTSVKVNNEHVGMNRSRTFLMGESSSSNN